MKTKRKACGAIVPLMICASVCAATSLTPVYAAGLEVFPQTVEMQFPQGYDVHSDAGKLLKTLSGPTSATIRAKTSGKSFAAGEVYLSDWSYDHLQQGKLPNWIVPKSNAAADAVYQGSAPSGAPTGLVIYPAIKEVAFPEGYNVFSDDGHLIKAVPGPTSIALKGETGGKPFANGTAYLSDWSYDQLQQEKSPNWVVNSVAHSATPSRNEIHTSAADLVVYPSPQKKEFPFGYTSYEGNTITSVETPASIILLGESKQARSGAIPAFFAEWSQGSRSADREPKAWIVPQRLDIEPFEENVQFPGGYQVLTSGGDLV